MGTHEDERDKKAHSTALPEDAAGLVRAGLLRALANCVALEFRVRSASWFEPAEGAGAGLLTLAAEIGRFGDAIGRRIVVLGLAAPPSVTELECMGAVSLVWSPEDWRRRLSALADALLLVSEDCHAVISIARNAGEEASICVLASLLSRCEEASWALRRDWP